MKKMSVILISGMICLTILASCSNAGAVAYIQKGNIYGKIIDSSGVPVRDALVSAVLVGQVKPTLKILTDDNGEYTLELEPGQYMIFARKLGVGTGMHPGILTVIGGENLGPIVITIKLFGATQMQSSPLMSK